MAFLGCLMVQILKKCADFHQKLKENLELKIELASDPQYLASSCWTVQDNIDVRSSKVTAAVKISWEMRCYMNTEAGVKWRRANSSSSCEAIFFSLTSFLKHLFFERKLQLPEET